MYSAWISCLLRLLESWRTLRGESGRLRCKTALWVALLLKSGVLVLKSCLKGILVARLALAPLRHCQRADGAVTGYSDAVSMVFSHASPLPLRPSFERSCNLSYIVLKRLKLLSCTSTCPLQNNFLPSVGVSPS